MKRIVVIGGGAAGMAAAIGAAGEGREVILCEKNEKLGKKLYITGKGRCNLTSACDTEDLFSQIVTNRKFLYSAVYGFTNFDIMALIEEAGCPLKTERGNRVFPVSDKSSDILAALQRILKKKDVHVRLHTQVSGLVTGAEQPEDTCETSEAEQSAGTGGMGAERTVPDGKQDAQEAAASRCVGVRLADGEILRADAVILATGGLSYPSTGSTGDGYRFAAEAGHTVTPLSPALVPFTCAEEDVKALQGLSLRNIEVQILDGKKLLWKEFGEMLFTHFGVSGPVVLSASSYAAKRIKEHPLSMTIDLKPALTLEQLDARILRDFEQEKNRQFKNALAKLFPSKLIPVMVARSGIDPEKQVNAVTAEERLKLAELTKCFRVTLTGLRDYNEAIITQGGVNVKEVNPATMESRLLPGLYLAGELLDLDGVTGGFNLQIAWSTGMAAGRSAAGE